MKRTYIDHTRLVHRVSRLNDSPTTASNMHLHRPGRTYTQIKYTRINLRLCLIWNMPQVISDTNIRTQSPTHTSRRKKSPWNRYLDSPCFPPSTQIKFIYSGKTIYFTLLTWNHVVLAQKRETGSSSLMGSTAHQPQISVNGPNHDPPGIKLPLIPNLPTQHSDELQTPEENHIVRPTPPPTSKPHEMQTSSGRPPSASQKPARLEGTHNEYLNARLKEPLCRHIRFIYFIQRLSVQGLLETASPLSPLFGRGLSLNLRPIL